MAEPPLTIPPAPPVCGPNRPFPPRPAGTLDAARTLAEPLVALFVGFGATAAATWPLIAGAGLELPLEHAPAELLAASDPGLVPRLLAVQAAVFTLLGWALIRWRVVPRRSATAASALPACGPGRTLLWGIGGGVGAIVLSGLASVLLAAVGLEVEEQSWVLELLRQPDALARFGPWVVVIVPLSEEVFFRGYLFRFVGDRLGVGIALAYSSTVFAGVHLNPSGLPLYVVIGVVFGWTYQRTGRLAVPVIAHAVLNGSVLAWSILAEG